MCLHMHARSLHAVHKQHLQVEHVAGMCSASSLLQTTPCCTCAESVLSQAERGGIQKAGAQQHHTQQDLAKHLRSTNQTSLTSLLLQ